MAVSARQPKRACRISRINIEVSDPICRTHDDVSNTPFAGDRTISRIVLGTTTKSACRRRFSGPLENRWEIQKINTARHPPERWFPIYVVVVVTVA